KYKTKKEINNAKEALENQEKELTKILKNKNNIEETGIDALVLLEPFLEVIRSGDTNGPITASALGSVEKFLTYGILNINSPNLPIAMSMLSSAATHCKFEASDSVSDEFVLLKILQVLRLALTCEVGRVLSDEALCEMMETGLSMCCQMRLSEPATWLPQDEGEGDSVSFQDSQVRMAPPDPKLPRLPLSSEYDNLPQNNNTTTFASPKNEIVKDLSLDDANDDLIKLDKNGEEVRNEVIPDQGQDAVGGRTIGRFEPLRALAVDELCKYLFQLARTDNMLLLSLTLRVISTVFGTLRPYLKLQQELYLSFLIERLTPPASSVRSLAFDAEFSNTSTNDSPLQSGTSTPSTNRERNLRASGETATATGEVRELLLESLGQFAREPSFMADLWVNYDCDIDCGDLFEEVVKFLSKSYPSASDLLLLKQQKQILREGAARFNENPKTGIEFLQAFSTAPNDATLQKAITGFHQCALLSAQYKLYDVFDYIIMSLSKMTGLLGAHYSNETANNPLVKFGNTEITVSDLSIQFGRNYKGQLAAVVLFAVANEHGNILREAGTTTIPLKPKTAPQSKQERSRDNSLLSALSSYLLSPYSGNYESSRSDPTDEEIECSMCTVDCVSVCRLEELFADIRLLEQPSLEYLMKALKFIADGNTATKIGDTKIGYPSLSPAPSPTTSQAPLRGSSYDPAAVFFLELMINVTLQNRDRIQHLWYFFLL
ncbi:14258_t:CDS:2, partial [Racocetra fulgida]